MIRKYLSASLTLAVVVSGAATALSAAAIRPPDCRKVFTRHMGVRAVRAVYAGSRDVSGAERAMLRRIVRCQWTPSSTPYLHHLWARDRRAWLARRAIPSTPFQEVASWYYDGGGTACGFHAGFGVANKILPCGTKVTFRYGGRHVTAVVDDRGPFIGGRDWDLNQNTAGALGFGGVGTVASSVYGR